MGRVSGSAVQPMTALGDTLYGGAGAPTSFVNVATNARGVVPISARGTFNGDGPLAAFDGNDATGRVSVGGVAGADQGVDLLAPFRIGRYRLVQYSGGDASVRATDVTLQSSVDGVTWTDRDHSIVALFADSGNILLRAPISARYWRFLANAGGGGTWSVSTMELHAVTTVGAGNPSRLPPPAGRRIYAFDPDAGVPIWQDLQAAIVPLGGTVGVDVAAAGPAQVALKAELDATNNKLNTLLAELRSAGIVAP